MQRTFYCIQLLGPGVWIAKDSPTYAIKDDDELKRLWQENHYIHQWLDAPWFTVEESAKCFDSDSHIRRALGSATSFDRAARKRDDRPAPRYDSYAVFGSDGSVRTLTEVFGY